MTTASTFDLAESIELLARTPSVVATLLGGLPDHWIHANEGEGTWSPFDVVGHFIHGERTDWMTRARIILDHGDTRPFESFDRHGHEAWWDGWSLDRMLTEFRTLRASNLVDLRGMALTDSDLDLPGMHPELGPVTMRQLLSTWVVHDLHHLCQIERAMAKRYAGEVGAWRAYISVLR